MSKDNTRIEHSGRQLLQPRCGGGPERSRHSIMTPGRGSSALWDAVLEISVQQRSKLRADQSPAQMGLNVREALTNEFTFQLPK